MKQTRATKIGFGILMQRGKGVIGILVQKAVVPSPSSALRKKCVYSMWRRACAGSSEAYSGTARRGGFPAGKEAASREAS